LRWPACRGRSFYTGTRYVHKIFKRPCDLRAAGQAVGLILHELAAYVKLGVTTAELDRMAARLLALHAARPAPASEYGFPGSICISVNEEAIHGIPGNRPIAPADLVKLDLTAQKDGYIAGSARTVAVPPLRGSARSDPLRRAGVPRSFARARHR